jgi:hypothetical protein
MGNTMNAKIAEQHKFVAWWEGTVTPNKKTSQFGNHRSVITVMSEPQAKKLTGIGKVEERKVSNTNSTRLDDEHENEIEPEIAGRDC